MENNSVQEILDWLKVKPRMLGWGAVLAYGRSETNAVLLQEYVHRFASADYMAPITEEILDNQSPTSKDFLHNYQMDAPRLSFLDSTLQKSSARVTMKVVGGSHLKFNKAPGNSQWTLSSVAEEDALDGPTLKYKIDLVASSGSVTSAGEVILDISTGTEYEMTGFDSPHLQRVAGARMQAAFRPLPDSVKKFKLNKLEFTPDQALKPAGFEIRTHNKKGSGANLLSSEDEGEGAVLLFVRMEGEQNGTLPVDNADFKYLLPDGYTATVLIGEKIFTETFMAKGLFAINELPIFTYTPLIQDEVIFGIKGIQGGIKLESQDVMSQRYSMKVPVFELKFDEIYHEIFDSRFVCHLPGFIVSYNPSVFTDSCGVIASGFQLIPATLYVLDGAPVTIPGNFLLTYGSFIAMEFSIEGGSVVFKRTTSASENYYKILGEDFYEYDLDLSLVYQMIEKGVVNSMEAAFERYAAQLPVINAFTLNSLLFRGDNSVNLESAFLARDIALFGHVGPTSTTFTIVELEPVIGHSEVFKFTTNPPRNDLKWAVHNIIDETVPKGSIGELSGLYTAPVASELEGNFVRVRVTASVGGHTSSALVTVMRRGITVNPMIRIATASDPLALDVSAGTIGGGALQWSVSGETTGAIVKPNPAGGHSYVPGPKQAKTPPSIDTITVHDPARNVSETAKVLVLHRTVFMSVVIDERAVLPPNQIQLAIMGEDGPINPGDWKETWKVLLGGSSAQINPKTGLLIINPNGPDRYVVVVVLSPGGKPGQPDDDGYILLPIPMFGVPQAIQMLCADCQ